jgi:hypothetical protein
MIYTPIQALDMFGFGSTNSTNQYYENFTFTDVNPQMSLSFRGMGMPQQQFVEFSALLSVISSGQSSCIEQSSGYCVLPQECSMYNDFWDYDFKIKFEGVDNYIRVPLSTFAANIEVQGSDLCAIFIEMLSEDYGYDGLILGSMFFQNIYAYMNTDGSPVWTINLFVNKNAVTGTYVGAEYLPQGDNPFQVYSYDLNPMAEQDGLPTFAATADGIDSTEHPSPYFYLDFSTMSTILWGVDCTHAKMGSYNEGDCSGPPTLMQNYFDGSDLPTADYVTDFNSQRFGGYTVSG